MRVHLGSPAQVSALIRYFEERADCVVRRVGATELEVSLLGSYRAERHDATVERLVADFRAGLGEAREKPTVPNGNGSNGHA